MPVRHLSAPTLSSHDRTFMRAWPLWLSRAPSLHHGLVETCLPEANQALWLASSLCTPCVSPTCMSLQPLGQGELDAAAVLRPTSSPPPNELVRASTFRAIRAIRAKAVQACRGSANRRSCWHVTRPFRVMYRKQNRLSRVQQHGRPPIQDPHPR
ncbi:hypothetical protein P171DRAFT_96400 [Karstenula rhodostoma CBS 690.94]|uniref:Uncharacterized protein n=1 Tax=Karstenula rhodostoma CBS 690.94 TaxID=1392251 RepID=A0A9P4U9R9_9PLEO|nr:hypothetical protein P171DRAFT_96400 [Karstenula rhodostoma CBS 690.94]